MSATRASREKKSADRGPEQTRLCLMQAAKKLFASLGFEGTSVKTLADEAGVNVSLVSYHYGGKEGLYKACVSQFTERNLATAKRILQAPASAEEFRVRLRMFLEELFQSYLTEPELIRIIHRDMELEKPYAMEIFGSTIMKSAETLVNFIKTGQKIGAIRKDVDPLMSMALVMGAAQHLMRIDHVSERFFQRTLKNSADRERTLDHFIKVFLEGLEPRPVSVNPER